MPGALEGFGGNQDGENAPGENDLLCSGTKELIQGLESGTASPCGGLCALVVDGENEAREDLRNMLMSLEAFSVFEARNLAEGGALLRYHKPNILFLEADLPDGCGFELVNDLRPQVAVVVLSRTSEAAVRAFDYGALDFLAKPIEVSRLQKTVQRFRLRLPALKRAAVTRPPRLQDSLLVKTLTEKKLIKASEVTHISAYGEYSWVYWNNDSRGALLRKSLKQWLSELPSDRFIRVHRRAIVNLAYLKRIERLPNGRMQIHLREILEPILVSLRLAPVLNRRLKLLSKSGRVAKGQAL